MSPLSKVEKSMQRSIRWITVLLWVTVMILLLTLYFSFRAAVDVATGAERQSMINEELIGRNQEVLQDLICITTLETPTRTLIEQCLQGGP